MIGFGDRLGEMTLKITGQKQADNRAITGAKTGITGPVMAQ
jgi:hypothetical protein